MYLYPMSLNEMQKSYTRLLNIRPEWKGKRLFLCFEGANSVANLFINGQHVGEHRGGYSALVFEITNCVAYDKPNTLLVRVNNAEQLETTDKKGALSDSFRCNLSESN